MIRASSLHRIKTYQAPLEVTSAVFCGKSTPQWFSNTASFKGSIQIIFVSLPSVTTSTDTFETNMFDISSMLLLHWNAKISE